ncbi:MAG: hypothetical protein JEY99_10025 [Spirochaetales bacterium]|nr:hypothetical protein [Spirochaetales bacterium]
MNIKNKLAIIIFTLSFLITSCDSGFFGLFGGEEEAVTIPTGTWIGPDIEFDIIWTGDAKYITNLEYTVSGSKDGYSFTLNNESSTGMQAWITDNSFSFHDDNSDHNTEFSGTIDDQGTAIFNLNVTDNVAVIGEVTVSATFKAAPALEVVDDWSPGFNQVALNRQGDLLYSAGTSLGIYDLTSSDTAFLSSLTLSKSATGLTVFGDYAYTSFRDYDNPGFLVIDVSDSGTPEGKGLFVFDRVLDDNNSSHNVGINQLAAHGDTVFVAAETGLYQVNCTDKTAPVMTAVVIEPFSPFYGAVVFGDTLYTISRPDSEAANRSLVAYTISSTGGLTEAGSLTVSPADPDSDLYELALDDNRLILYTSEGLAFYDVAEGAVPTLLYNWEAEFDTEFQFLNSGSDLMALRPHSRALRLYENDFSSDPQAVAEIHNISNPCYAAVVGDELVVVLLSRILRYDLKYLSRQKLAWAD